MGITTFISHWIRHFSESSSTKIPTSTDVVTDSHTWSAETSGFSCGMDTANGPGPIVGIDSSMKSMAGISWVVQSAVGSGSSSAEVMDGKWDSMLASGFSLCFSHLKR